MTRGLISTIKNCEPFAGIGETGVFINKKVE